MPGAEHLVGAVGLGERQVALLAGDAVRRGTARAPRARVMPSGQATSARREHAAAVHDEHVRRVRLGDEAAHVEHQRVVGAGDVGLDLGEDRLEQVVVVDLRVEAVGREAPHAAGDEREPVAVVDRRLVLGEHDQRRARLVEPRIHAGGDLHAAREREADVHAVAHAVRLERAADLGR